MSEMNSYCNELWKSTDRPYITIVTGTYNRANTIGRAIESVIHQTYGDYEYIIIDDGSIDDTDLIVKKYIDQNIIPMMYIKKQNGGVHTARNMGIKIGRGRMYIGIDSDDELMPNALKKFVDAWECIGNKNKYFEIKARCIDQDNNEVGPKFPESINQMPWNDAKKLYESIIAEHIGFRRLDILKENLFPEPEGVTFVCEDLLWFKLRNMYKSYFINDIVRIYHMDGNDHLGIIHGKKIKSSQNIINSYWDAAYRLNNHKLYIRGLKDRLLTIARYITMGRIIKRNRIQYNTIRLNNSFNRILYNLLLLPGAIFSYYYEHSYYKQDRVISV